MSINDETLNTEPTAELFQKKLRRLLVNNESPVAQSLLRKPEYQSALFDSTANTWQSYYKELNAYVDAAKALSPPVNLPVAPSPAVPAASRKGPMISPQRVRLPGSSNGSSTSTNTTSKSGSTPSKSSNTPSKSGSTPSKSSTTRAQNWFSLLYPPHKNARGNGKS